MAVSSSEESDVNAAHFQSFGLGKCKAVEPETDEGEPADYMGEPADQIIKFEA
jgi:hypothetical protein